ncbi:MAG: 4-(cytidine 5'-diphospho)-2-C-methyl-D-erythritol kinase [Thermoleophilia bacterium]|jgi:4-diphosphocytidyl-2-C-methyl-D-erythritol kinase
MHETNRNIAEVRAPAKINLWLHVGPLEADGFHPVCSLMDRVTIADTLQARRAPDEGMRLSVYGMDNDAPQENLVMRAARALEQAAGKRMDVDIDLTKKIPVAAGLGGGSSDAAAILKLLVFLFELDIHETKLMEIAGVLGSDVPFFMTSGPQLAEGKGDILMPVRFGFDYAVVIVNPGIRLSTADVYQLYDETAGASRETFANHVEWAHEEIGRLDSLDALVNQMHNDLESPARSLCPEIDGIEQGLRASGAAAVLVSGSGPSVFGVYEDSETASRACEKLGKTYPLTWAATPVPGDA